jgi:hypothetical protein
MILIKFQYLMETISLHKTTYVVSSGKWQYALQQLWSIKRMWETVCIVFAPIVHNVFPLKQKHAKLQLNLQVLLLRESTPVNLPFFYYYYVSFSFYVISFDYYKYIYLYFFEHVYHYVYTVLDSGSVGPWYIYF